MNKEQKKENETSYCQQRLEQYGITNELNRFKVNINEKVADQYPEAAAQPFFWESENGGINILYLALNGSYEQFVPDGSRWKQKFVRERLHPTKCTDEQKYTQPGKSGIHIFFTPTIIEKYNTATPIETLYVVEGEFKAFLGYMNGLDIVGIPSIHAFKEKDDNDLHPDLRELIRVCKPESLVLLFDADATAIKWDKWKNDPEYDLGKRLNTFYRAVFNLRDWTKNIVKDVYFTQLKEELLRTEINNEVKDTVKGLDDLILHRKDNSSEVVDDLKKLSSANRYFYSFNISDESPAKIKRHFLLNRNKHGIPDDFFNRFSDQLRPYEFKFLSAKYKFNGVSDQLELTRHSDSEMFIRVGCDYMKIIQQPSAKKILERKLVPWKSGEISRDYVNRGFKNFFETIPKFDSFCNVPDNTETYRQVINNCYNLYFNVVHRPEPGKWEVTDRYLHHIFGEKYDVALDYITILYRLPTQKLPILVLVSKDRSTGKSTFLWWLRELFGENTTVVGNQEITDRFNDDYASKLVIGIDEGFIEKRAVLERIKSWSTASRIKVDTKNVSRAEIDFFGKIIITSNHEDSFIHVDEEEIRFFVNKVPKFTEEDPDMLEKLKDEIPAFFNELKNRTIKYEKKTRHWFHPDVIRTAALDKVRKASKGWLQQDIEQIMQEKFIHYKYPILGYTITELKELLPKHRQGEISRLLMEKMGMESKLQRIEFPLEPEVQNSVAGTQEKHGRLFCFKIEDFVSAEDIAQLGIKHCPDLK